MDQGHFAESFAESCVWRPPFLAPACIDFAFLLNAALLVIFAMGVIAGACLHQLWRRRAAGVAGRAPATDRTREAGNVFFALFAAMGMIGVIGSGLMTVMKGPVTSIQHVTKHSIAENHMIAATRLAIISASTQQPDHGDCDADGFVEPIPYRDAGADAHPAGGGYIPVTIGAALADPWQQQYGYCVWDHGAVTVSDNDAGCGGSAALRLEGAPTDTQLAVVVISAGKDRIFQTACAAYADANADNVPDTPLVNRPAGSDDIVLGHTYAEANTAVSGLWALKSGEPETAAIDKGIEVSGDASFGGSLRLAGGLLLPDQTSSGACSEANDQQLRRNTSGASPALEICDWQAGAGDWAAIGGGGGGGAAAGGTDRQIQYNDAGALGGVTGFEYETDGTLRLDAGLGVGTAATADTMLRVVNPAASGVTYGGDFEAASANGTAVHGLATATSGSGNYGVWGQSAGTSGSGVYGYATAATGATYGVYGQSGSNTGTGVYGWAMSGAGATYGVSGRANSINGRGVYGYAPAAAGGNFGGYFESSGSTGMGVFGWATSTTGANYGAYGQSASNAGVGVYGWASAGTGSTYGVGGRSNSTAGTGVSGYAGAATGSTKGVHGSAVSTSGIGIYGYAGATSGSTYGGYFQTDSTSGAGVSATATAATGNTFGVQGWASSTSGRGVQGTASATSGAAAGGYFQSASTSGIGVLGLTTAATGANFGAYGQSASTSGMGVYGQATAATGSTNGGYFQSDSVSGRGVYGFAGAATGVNYGVWGESSSSAGYGVYCQATNNANGCGGNRAWFNASDARLKDHVEDLNPESGLSAILRLRPVTYSWRNADNGKTEIGFIAQEVEKVLPALVGSSPDATVRKDNGADETITDVKSLSYATFVVPLVKAVQELKADNDNLRARIDKLEAERARSER